MDEIARAFNKGCDARLNGASKDCNPYSACFAESAMYHGWRRGWLHVHDQWGKDVKRKWFYWRLPVLRQAV